MLLILDMFGWHTHVGNGEKKRRDRHENLMKNSCNEDLLLPIGIIRID